MAARKTKTAKATRRRKAEPKSTGLTAAEAGAEPDDPALRTLAEQVEADGGAVLARFRDPLGGTGLVLAALPIDTIAPTPFQRDLSPAHVKRLEDAIRKVGVFLDPVIGVRAPDGAAPVAFWTPNGLHRLAALRRIGARSVTALLAADPALAYRILALNTEKAHNTKERALEAVRMARGLAELDATRLESEFALELEDGAFVTLGFAYEERARFAGGAYAPALRASDAFLDEPLSRALAIRRERAQRLLALDDRVAELVAQLKERGFDSPYLRNFVVARIRPFRPRGQPAPDADALLDHMEQKAAAFDVGRIRAEQVAKTVGGGD